jgi:hypothetical protein
MQVTIKRVSVKEVQNNFGGVSKKYGIQTAEHGDKWLSCFENKYNGKELATLKEGATLNIIVMPSGEYLNFRFANATDKLEERIKILESIVLSKQNVGIEPIVVAGPTTSQDDTSVDNW